METEALFARRHALAEQLQAPTARGAASEGVAREASARRVLVVVFDGVDLLDATGPASVFANATHLIGDRRRGYRVELAALAAGPVATHGGLRIHADRALSDVRGPIDTLLVAGGPDAAVRALRDRELADAIRRISKRCRRIASVCTGAFVLANAGLLEGKRVVTHWSACAELRERHPTVRIDPDPIFVRDGDVWTSAGGSSGIDLGLALVEEDFGRALAAQVARRLVLYLRRGGGQSQLSMQLAFQCSEEAPLRDLLDWVREHPKADLTIGAMAAHVHMSVRHFARVFRQKIGITPGAYVDAVRFEHARAALETTQHPVKVIAREAGFGTAETMSRVFQRSIGLPPIEVRRRSRS